MGKMLLWSQPLAMLQLGKAIFTKLFVSRRKRTGFFLGDDGTAFQSHQLRRPEALSQRGRAEKMCGMRSAKEMEGTIDCGRTDQRIGLRQTRQRNQRTDSPRIFGCGKRAGPVS